MFGLSNQGFYTLLLIGFILCIVAFIRVRRKYRFKVRIRTYRDSREEEKPEFQGDALWVCPQCYEKIVKPELDAIKAARVQTATSTPTMNDSQSDPH